MPDLATPPKRPTLPPSCRLFVLLARAAPVGVVFRRGPSRWVQVVRWDTASDTFTPGQWFHGRLYGERGDLSPDGTLMLYYAEDMRPRARGSAYTTHWTAISRPPYLTALALWPNGGEPWSGGGLFLSDTDVWLDHGSAHADAHPDHPPQGLTVSARGESGGWVSAEARRMTRDGWETVQEWQWENVPGRGPITRLPRIQHKPNPRGAGALTLTTGKADYVMRQAYSVSDARGVETPLTGAAWADWDRRGRLVFVRDGRLFAASGVGPETARELVDLNANTFDAVKAPDWARRW